MANQAFSEAADLMVGAGEIYFSRNDDPNGYHHIGNVEEMNITTDVTTVEKNSSMNKRRELMASVVTAVAPSASLTLTEYNPYNLALGLYGVESVQHQAPVTLTGERYTVVSKPGIIQIVDPDGKTYYTPNITGVGLASPIPASVALGAGSANKFTNSVGTGSADFNIASVYTGATSKTYYFAVKSAPTAAGDVAGLDIVYSNIPLVSPALVSAATSLTASASSGATATYSVDGIEFTVNFGASDTVDDYATNPVMITVVATAATSTLVKGKDYIVEEQSGRAGFIKIPTGSVLNAGDVILVDATIPEGDFVTVSGANAGEIEGKLMFVGDPNQGDQYIIEAWDVKVQPDGDLSGLISEDFGSFSLNLKFLANYQENPEYPYYKITKVGSASGTEVVSGTYDPLN